MATKARPYQQADLDALPEREAWMLGYDMGTGKSFVVVRLCDDLDMFRVLIVCPVAVGPVWVNEFAKHSCHTERTVVDLTSGTGTKRNILLNNALRDSRPCAIIINYDMVWRKNILPLLQAVRWSLITCDESQRIKDPKTRAFRAIRSLGLYSKKRLCLTGTPMENPMDVFGQYAFLDSRIFGRSFHAFKHRYCKMGGYRVNGRPVQIVGYQNLDELKRKFYSIATRVRKEDVLDLPPFTHQIRYVQLSPKSMQMHNELKRHLITEYKGGFITAANALVKLTRLQQITSGYIPVERDDVKRPERISKDKANELCNVLGEISGSEPVVTFSRFTGDVSMISEVADGLGRRNFHLTGARKELEEWQKRTDGSVLAANVQAGSVGVDTTRACYVIYYSHPLSNLLYNQSLSRSHRAGQDRPVTYIHLIARGTVDERILQLLQKKEDLVKGILGDLEQGVENDELLFQV